MALVWRVRVCRRNTQKWVSKRAGEPSRQLSASAHDAHPLSVAAPLVGGAPPARSKGRTMRRRKSFNIPLVKTAAGLALFSLAKGSQTSKTVLADPLNALEQTGANLIANKEAAVSIGVASLAAQFVSSDVLRKKEIGAIGPIKLKV